MEEGKCLVYIAVFNASSFIRQTLDAVLAQDYPNFEIVLTDDCSTDDSRGILMEYVEKHPDKIHYRENCVNLGIGRTLYTAYQEFHDADYFAGTGHDDLWEYNYLSSQIQRLNQGDCVASFARYRYADIDGKVLKKAVFANEILNGLSQEELFLKLLEGNFLFAASGVVSLKAIGRERFGSFFGYDSDRLQDYEMWLNLSLYGKICYNPETSATYSVMDCGMGSGAHYVLQEKYEKYSAIRRALFSNAFTGFLHRIEDPLTFVDKIVTILTDKAKHSYLFGLLLMDFAQERLNKGEGTDLCQNALDHYYYECGLLTKSLHGRKNMVKMLKLACNNISVHKVESLIKDSACFSLCASQDEADLYVTDLSGICDVLAACPIVCLADESAIESKQREFPEFLFIADDCTSTQFQDSLLRWAEDHTDLRRNDIATYLVRQELESLKSSEVYNCGRMIYKIAERSGILALIKKRRKKGVGKYD